MVESIKLEFGDTLNVKEGEYRILYEAAFSDIEAIIASNNDVNNWNFDITNVINEMKKLRCLGSYYRLDLKELSEKYISQMSLVN